jgi:hypothetical protein
VLAASTELEAVGLRVGVHEAARVDSGVEEEMVDELEEELTAVEESEDEEEEEEEEEEAEEETSCCLRNDSMILKPRALKRQPPVKDGLRIRHNKSHPI